MQIQTANTIDINTLVDIKDILIDTSLPVAERQKSYLRQIKNPNCFRYGDMIVRTSYLSTGPTLQDRIKQLLLSGQGTELTLF